METEIINRVAASPLQTFDLEELYTPGQRATIDIKDQLHHGLVLREAPFREWIKAHPWQQYQNQFVAITCSADAIVPTWAFMLVAVALQPFSAKTVFGTPGQLEHQLFLDKLNQIDFSAYRRAKVVIKGCSKVAVPTSVYIEAVNRLRPVVSSLMFGEPCSTVPLFKAKSAGV
jgi:hypothetical protein